MSFPAIVFGSTGLVGSKLLAGLLELREQDVPVVHTIGRRKLELPAASRQPDAHVEPDTEKWGTKLSALVAGHDDVPKGGRPIVFSALGTTRAQAGSFAAQWKIDHDLNVRLIEAARGAGADAFVFVSSAGTSGFLASRLPYGRMKNAVENELEYANFPNAIVLRPGLLMGRRDPPRALETALEAAVDGVGKLLGRGVRDAVAQDGEVVARAAIRAARLVRAGLAPDRFWVLEQKDIIRLGREEYDLPLGGTPSTEGGVDHPVSEPGKV